MTPDIPEPSWVARYRKVIVAAGGFILEGIALWQDAPAWVLGVGFVTTVLVGAIGNAQKPAARPSTRV